MSAARRLAADAHGVATLEYVIVLALVAVLAGLAVAGLGPLLLSVYRYQQALLLLPFP